MSDAKQESDTRSCKIVDDEEEQYSKWTLE